MPLKEFTVTLSTKRDEIKNVLEEYKSKTPMGEWDVDNAKQYIMDRSERWITISEK